MKKLIYILLILSSFIANTYALNVGDKGVEKTQNNSNILLNIFSIDTIINIVFAVLAVVLTYILSKIISSKIGNFIEKKDGEGNKGELIGVVTRTINIIVLSIGFTIALSILGVDIGIFLGGFGFGLGFTLKIFLSNFIGGIVMVTQGNYHNGDLIKIGDKIGYIRKINSLFTEVEQFDGVIFYIPNLKFLENEVENFHINDKRRVEINIGVDFDTDIVKAKKIMLQVIENFPGILKNPETTVLISQFNESSITLSLRFWISSKGKYFNMKSNVTETINLAFRQYGIKIPFPQITISNRSDFKLNGEKQKN